MHLADGIVTRPEVLVGLNLVGAGAVAVAARKADTEDGRAVAWSGLLAAFVLAAQAINVPLLPGTSAHAIGATLVTLAVGPARAIVALTAVLFVQALLFGDGGLTVLGINVLDLAVLPALSVALVRRALGGSRHALALGSVLGSVLGNVVSAGVLATTLVFGAGASARVAFPWLVGVHALTGAAEGMLTATAVQQLVKRAPGLISEKPARHGGGLEAASGYRAAMAWTAIFVGIAVASIPLASTAPDALERLLSGAMATR